ncbi:NAD(P)-binding protein [Aspergillus californicus]
MGAKFSQFFPPRPTFTEQNVPSQKGRVFLITGGTSGIGFELARIPYRQGDKVYITGRTEEKAKKAIQAIQDSGSQTTNKPSDPDTLGQLDYIVLELDDLRSIKASVDAFKAKESKLDVLWNNAGVSQPPLGSVSKQGYELQLATNCLGPFLFTQLLLPLLDAAIPLSIPGAVRGVWLSSQVAELSSPPEGLIMSELTSPPKNNIRNYLNSKVGNWLLSAEFARRHGHHGIVSVALNPGAANTDLLKNLYADLSPNISLQNNGCYVIPFGRIHDTVETLLNAMKVEEDSGTGRAREFWEFCEEKVKDYI